MYKDYQTTTAVLDPSLSLWGVVSNPIDVDYRNQETEDEKSSNCETEITKNNYEKLYASETATNDVLVKNVVLRKESKVSPYNFWALSGLSPTISTSVNIEKKTLFSIILTSLTNTFLDSNIWIFVFLLLNLLNFLTVVFYDRTETIRIKFGRMISDIFLVCISALINFVFNLYPSSAGLINLFNVLNIFKITMVYFVLTYFYNMTKNVYGVTTLSKVPNFVKLSLIIRKGVSAMKDEYDRQFVDDIIKTK